MAADHHIRFFPQCGICADVILKNERLITRMKPLLYSLMDFLLTQFAVFGNQDSTTYDGHTRPFPFSHRVYPSISVNGCLVCRNQICRTCSSSPEYAPIHYDCHEIFRKECAVDATDALCRLWILAAWRNPWRGALPLHLSSERPDRDMIRRVAHLGGFPLLSHLPLELVERV